MNARSTAAPEPGHRVPDLMGAIDDLRSGRSTAVQHVQAALDSAATTWHRGAFAFLDAERALTQARLADASPPSGPLHGIPLAVKDNIHVAGMPNTAGTAALNHFVPTTDAPSVARLRAARAIVIGKTRLHELAFGATSDTLSDGPIRKPSTTDAARAAAAAAPPWPLPWAPASRVWAPTPALRSGSRLHSTAWWGSGRRPGGTPPAGRPRCRTRATRSAPSPAPSPTPPCWTGCSPTTRPTRPARTVTVGVADDYFTQPLHPGTRMVWERARADLDRAGIHLVPVPMTGLRRLETEAGLPITMFEARRNLRRYLRQTGNIDIDELAESVGSPDVQTAMRAMIVDGAPDAITEEAYRRAQERRRGLQKQYRGIFTRTCVDVIAFPTTALPVASLPVGDTVDVDGHTLPTFLTYIHNTGPGTLARLTLSAGRTPQNLPVGLALTADPGPTAPSWRSAG